MGREVTVQNDLERTSTLIKVSSNCGLDEVRTKARVTWIIKSLPQKPKRYSSPLNITNYKLF